jgi:hypothetical protein
MEEHTMTTQDTQELFGELRSAAQDQDHAAGWTRMVAAIDKWQDLDSFKEQALPYLKESLKERDADEPRLAPASWADADGLHPAIELANALDLSNSQLDDAALAAAVADPRLVHIIELRLGNTSAGDATIAALVGNPHAAALRDLSLNGCTKLSTDAITMLAEATNMTALQRLDIRDLEQDVYELGPLFKPGYLLKLHDIRFRGNVAGHRDDIFSVFYEFMEATDQYGDTEYNGYYDDEEEDGDEEAEAEAEVNEDTARLTSLRASVESQILSWAEHISDGRTFDYFYDLME